MFRQCKGLFIPILFFMGKAIDLTGKKFERLTVIERLPNNKENKAVWLCVCDCGEYRNVIGKCLISLHTTSCGCKRKESMKIANTTHGINHNTPEYNTWVHIKDRCLNPKNISYKNYGGRGISVSNLWVNDFKSFFDYVGKRPSRNHSLDRYPNNNGNYEPNNVRWATRFEQMQNTRRNVWIEFNNEKMIVSEFSRRINTRNEKVRRLLSKGLTPNEIYELLLTTTC